MDYIMEDPNDPMSEARRLTKLVQQLQQKRQRLGDGDRADPVLTAPGYGHNAPMMRTNYGGILANAFDSYNREKLDTQLEDTTNQAEEARRKILQQVMGSEGGMTPEKTIQLSEAGVDPQMLKLIQPEKLSKGAMYQALAQNPSLAPLFVGQGLIDQHTADSLVASTREQKQLDKQDKMDIAAAGRSVSSNGRAESDAEWFQRDPEGYANYMKVKHPAAAGAGGKNSTKMTTEEVSATLDTSLNELDSILNDPKALKQVTSPGQRTAAVLREQGAKDNPNIVESGLGMLGKAERSPAAARLERLGNENAFGIVQKLYPASNSDVMLAKSQFAQIGDSPESMREFSKTMRRLQGKIKSGEVRVQDDSTDTPAPVTPAGKDGWIIEEAQ